MSTPNINAGENATPVDRQTPAPAEPPPDHVHVKAADLVSLRARAALADTLERDAAGTLSSAALTEATGPVSFTDDVAARHARALLAARIVVRPDSNGKLVAVDRETGRPAAEALREVLAGDEFKRYLAPTSRGGASRGQSSFVESHAPANTVEAGGMALAQRMGHAGPNGKLGGFGGFYGPGS